MRESGKGHCGNSIVKTGILYVGAGFLFRGISFLMTPVFTRLMSTEEYGTVNLYAVYLAVLTPVLGLELHQSLKVREHGSDYKEYIMTVLFINVVMTAMGGAVLLFFSEFLSGLLELKRKYLLFLLMQSFGWSLQLLYTSYLNLQYKVWDYTIFSMLVTMGNVVLSVLLVLKMDDKVYGRIIGQAVPYLAAGILAGILLRKGVGFHLERQHIRFALGFGIPMAFNAISLNIMAQFDKIIIVKLVGKSENGIYSLGNTLSVVMTQFWSSLMIVYTPLFMEKMRSHNSDQVKEITEHFVSAVTGVSVMAILAAPEIIRIISPVEYGEAVYAAVPLLVGGYFVFLKQFQVEAECYYGKTKYMAYLTILSSLLNIVLNMVLIPVHGYIAAAYTTLISYIFLFLSHYILVRRLYKGDLFGIRGIAVNIGIIFAVGSVGIAAISAMWVRLFLFLVFLAFYYRKIIRIFAIRRQQK